MTQEIKSLIEDSNKLVAAMRDAVEAKADASTVARIEAKLAETLAAKSTLESRLAAVETAAARPGSAVKSKDADVELKDAFLSLLRNPSDYQAKNAYMDLARKSVNTAVTTDGGFAVPSLIGAEIAAIATDLGAMRQLARVVQVSSSDYAEILDNSNAGFEWVGDNATRAQTANPTIARVKPTFGEISVDIPVSLGALEDMAFDAGSWLAQSIGRKFAEAEGIAFITGDGANKPTGLLNGTTVTTAKSGHASTIPSADCLIDLMMSIKGGYRLNSAFLMASTTLAAISKLKDTTGQYLVMTSVAAGVAPTLLGRPIYVDESMPLVAAAAKPIVFGDFAQGYLIADRVGVSLLNDPYSTTGYIRYKARKKVGGIVKDAAALKALVISV